MIIKTYILGLLFPLIMDTSATTIIKNDVECLNFLETSNCSYEFAEGRYKRSGLSRRYDLEIGKTVRYELVFYGGIEIVIQCCTEDDFYPIHFKLIKSESGKVIYDNKYNSYIDNLNLLLDHTELLAIEITVDPKESKIKKSKNGKACIGMAIYMEDNFNTR